jgi:nitrate reductase assembly molybdenum cofactor insertion protein NarJ
LPLAGPSTTLRASPADLASAYTDVFLLNVYPYGTAFTDPSGELNGPGAQRVAALYEVHGYRPPELKSVGAPDHLGLCLGFLAAGQDGLLPRIADWAPVCCLAVEREPSAHSFYRALASTTRQHLFVMLSEAKPPGAETPSASSGQALRFAQDDGDNLQSEIYTLQSEDEVRLRHIVRFFLTPALCGVFLSRSRLGQMAKELGGRLPFGSRFEVAEMLFTYAGGGVEQLGQLLNALETEVAAWATAYRSWAEKHPAWRPIAEMWLARTAEAARQLNAMRRMAAAAP